MSEPGVRGRRRIALPAVAIHSVDEENGFFIKSGDSGVFVMVNDPEMMKYRAGDAVILEGVVLALPPKLAADLKMPAGVNTTIYVYPDSVKSGR